MPHLLTVCSANLIRSVVLEHALRRELALAEIPGTVDSAGLTAVGGRRPPPELVGALPAHLAGAAEHRSRSLRPADLRRADLVLVMTEEHRDAVQRMLPVATRKTFTVREFVRLLDLAHVAPPARGHLPAVVGAAHAARPRSARPTEPEDVADVIGGPPEAYPPLVAELERLALAITAAAW